MNSSEYKTPDSIFTFGEIGDFYKETWIDAETHLRSFDNRTFHLEKVVQFLENSKKYVI